MSAKDDVDVVSDATIDNATARAVIPMPRSWGMPETDALGGRQFVERLRQVIARHTFPDLGPGQIPGLSAGVVAYPHSQVLRPEDLFTQVEAALDRGKKSEPDRIGVSGEMPAS